MSKLLRKFPLRVKPTKLTPATQSKLQRLINDKNFIETIQKEINLSESEVIDEIIILIRSGCPIQKTHLFQLVGVDDGMIDFIKNQATDEDLASLDDLSEIKDKFCSTTRITEQMLTLVLNFLKVRQLMKAMNVPYFDIDENKLMNGNALLDPERITCLLKESKEPETNGEETYEKKSSIKEFEYKASCSRNVMTVDSSKPLQTSQKLNQTNDIKKFEAKEPIQLLKRTIDAAQKPKPIVNAPKRMTVRAASKVEYLNSSDSDSEPETKRKVPQWISTKKPSERNSSQSLPKKSCF